MLAIEKRAVISALNRTALRGSAKGAVSLGLIIDVLVEGDTVRVLINERVGGPNGEPVPEDWVQALEAAVAAVAGVRAVHLERRPVGTAAPSLQQAARHSRPVLDFGSARVIAVASGKGGVGKSTATANLAVALAEAGQRVGVVDADIYGFSQPTLLGASAPPEVTPDKRWLPAQASGVKLISMDFFAPAGQAVIWRGPMLGKALLEFLSKTAWADIDFLLLDLPPGTGDIALDVHEMLPGSQEVVVTTPDPLAARVAVRAGQMAQRTGHTVLGVVENMSYMTCPHCGGELQPFGRGGGEQAAAGLGVPLLVRVPLGGPARRGTGIYDAQTPAGKAFRELAQGIVTADTAATM